MKSKGWFVYLDGREIDYIRMNGERSADDVKKTLIAWEKYPSDIEVTTRKRQTTKEKGKL